MGPFTKNLSKQTFICLAVLTKPPLFPRTVCAAGILIWRVLFVTSVIDTRGVDLLSFNLSLNGQEIISLEQVGQWRGRVYAELGKKI